MCLIAFAINASARWPLVIAANRDEFFDRPTLPLARWQAGSGQTIISGRDLRAGGSWLGITPGGRVAFVTNVRQGQPQAAPRSRGDLVTRWLAQDLGADDFIDGLGPDSTAYGGFNLVLGDLQRQTWAWVSNLAGTAASGWQTRPLPAGIYGLSNAAMDTPWPKTRALKQVLADNLTGTAQTLQIALWNALASRQRASRQQLPSTGVPLELEEGLSSAFVDLPERGYGTRCSTLLLASAADPDPGSWQVHMEERTHARTGHDASRPASRHSPVATESFALQPLGAAGVAFKAA